MSVLARFIHGSLVSRQRLMQAREFYSPSPRHLPAQRAFERWTRRVRDEPELAVARALAGLSGPELHELEAEFVRCPVREPAAWVRHAVAAGAVLIGLAVIGLGVQAAASVGEVAARTLQTTGIACLLLGLLSLGAGLLSAFGAVHLDLSHGTTGLYVGKLDEQHPWLYGAFRLTSNEVAEAYRQRILGERGFLRGADYVMMRELVRAQEALEQVRPARAVAEVLQSLPVVADPSTHEPRLFRVGSARESDPANESETFRRAAG